MKENTIKITICVILFTIALTIFGIMMIFKNKEEDASLNDSHEPITDTFYYTDIYDINEYQTVYQAIFNYFQVINEESDYILNLLFSNYITKNEITKTNVLSYVEKQYKHFGYSIKEIKKYTNSYYSIYDVIGIYSDEGLDEPLESIEVEDFILIDRTNNTYAVIPLINNKNSFEKNIEIEDLKNYNQEIKNNDKNNVQNQIMTEFNEATMYFSEFLSKLSSSCYEAYPFISDEMKVKYNNENEFVDFCSLYETRYLSPIIQSYIIRNEDEKKVITIKDNYSIQYEFFITSVKNYSVNITEVK